MDSQNKNLKINIKNNNIINIEIDSNKTIQSLKKEINDTNGYSIKKQKLFLNEIELEDNKKIKDYKISTLDILLCLIFN